MVNTRYGMYILSRYMTLLLDDGMTPCQLLVDWLRVALTRRDAHDVLPLARDIPATQGIASKPTRMRTKPSEPA